MAESKKELLANFRKLPERCQEMFFGALLVEEKTNWAHRLVQTQLDYSESESPIEQILAMALDISKAILDDGIFFEPQIEIETISKSKRKYRVDFLYDTETCGKYMNRNYQLVVECDGHDFHEKTKEQVAHDNERDLDLRMAGYDVLHFSGSQIYRNPLKIAFELHSYIKRKMGEENG